jgi:hypothetical protein
VENIVFLGYCLCFASGVFAAGAGFVLYLVRGNKGILHFGAFLGSLALVVLSLTLNKYFHIKEIVSSQAFFASFALSIAGMASALLALPKVMESVVGIPLSQAAKRTTLAGVLVFLGLSVVSLARAGVIVFAASVTVYFALSFSFVVRGMARYREITPLLLKKALRNFFIVSCVFLPLIALEIVRSELGLFPRLDFVELFTLPLYFFVLNAGGARFAFSYLARPKEEPSFGRAR